MDNAQLIERAVRGWELAIKGLEDRKRNLQVECDKALAQVQQEIDQAIKERDAISRQKYRLASGDDGGIRKGRSEKYRTTIIECLHRFPDGATQSDIGRECDIPISTVGRILKRNEEYFKKGTGERWMVISEVTEPPKEEIEEEVDI